MTPKDIQAEIERLHAAGFAWAMVCSDRNRERAEDVLQTSYLKVLDGRAAFEGRSSFKTFLFGVIRRTASEERRREAVSRLVFGSPAPEPGGAQPEEGLSLDLLALRRAVEGLPRRQREVLQLVLSMGMTLREASETLGITQGAASVHYARGKRRLAVLLEDRRLP
jgi:RNA polymerase sigma-70 factor (ECF subfamily)